MASCVNYTNEYNNILRNPNSYKGKRMKFLGQVQQRWTKGGSMCAFTMNLNRPGENYVGEVYCKIDSQVLNGGNLLQWDTINIYGEFEGLTDNLYTLEGYVSYPSINVKYIEMTN